MDINQILLACDFESIFLLSMFPCLPYTLPNRGSDGLRFGSCVVSYFCWKNPIILWLFKGLICSGSLCFSFKKNCPLQGLKMCSFLGHLPQDHNRLETYSLGIHVPCCKWEGEHTTLGNGDDADKSSALNTSSCLNQSSTRHRCGKWVLISCSKGAYRPLNSWCRLLACSNRCLIGICDNNMGDNHWGWTLLETEIIKKGTWINSFIN